MRADTPFRRNLSTLVAGLLALSVAGADFAWAGSAAGGNGGASGAGTGGAAGGSASGGGGGGVAFTSPGLPSTPVAAADVEAQIAAVTNEAMKDLDSCRPNDRAVKDCVAAALEKYAVSLERAAPKLPPQVRVAVNEVRRVAQVVATSKSTSRAIGAIKTVVAKVRSSLYVALVRADDPDSASIRDFALKRISAVLDHAAVALSRSTEI